MFRFAFCRDLVTFLVDNDAVDALTINFLFNIVIYGTDSPLSLRNWKTQKYK